jgi:hypothetical protein
MRFPNQYFVSISFHLDLTHTSTSLQQCSEKRRKCTPDLLGNFVYSHIISIFLAPRILIFSYSHILLSTLLSHEFLFFRNVTTVWTLCVHETGTFRIARWPWTDLQDITGRFHNLQESNFKAIYLNVCWGLSRIFQRRIALITFMFEIALEISNST